MSRNTVAQIQNELACRLQLRAFHAFGKKFFHSPRLLLLLSIKCAWFFCVNDWYNEDDAAEALFSSVTGLLTASRCCMDGSRSKSSVGVMLNCASACFTAPVQRHTRSFHLQILFPALVGCTLTSSCAGSRSMNKHIERKTIDGDHFLVCTHDRMVQVCAADETVINKKILVASCFLCSLGLAYKTIDIQVIRLLLHGYQF